jgi:hypothetical protein
VIVRDDLDPVLLIEQAAHARLAATIMRAWSADGLRGHPRRDPVLTAIEHHDDGWRQVDADPQLNAETGLPYDYRTYPLPARQELWYRNVDALAGVSGYAAALVAQHAISAYARYSEDPGWQPFFARLTERREQLLATEPNPGTAEFDADYAIVRLADLISLAFCQADPESTAHAGYEFKMEGAELAITPDPFGGARVPLAVEARSHNGGRTVTLRGSAIGRAAGSPASVP